MNTRIEALRKHKKMSRAVFGAELGVSGDVINNLERGRVEVKEPIIRLICAKFNVNEEWLRTGVGDMFLDVSREEDIAKLVVKLMAEEPDSFKNRFISALAKLSVEQWEVLESISNMMADSNAKKEE